MKKCKAHIFILVTAFLAGCAFTQRDYDLQEKKYERERKIQEQQSQGSMGWKW
ncbi:MAG TPA: hypothetical protein PLO93_07580 [Candidatus Omnitrophota bacterium]|nr:hypothetical protein [Candidatus Omnitrophota bacterium]HQL42135.1 hypothetical protein [Candidatus Omnitrophota bacterium]